MQGIKEDIDELTRNGLVSLLYAGVKDLEFPLLKYLEGKYPTIYHQAAFSWLMKSDNKAVVGQLELFLEDNPGYIETYIGFPTILKDDLDDQYLKLSNFLPMYCVKEFSSKVPTSLKFKYGRFDTLKLDGKSLLALSEELPQLFDSLSTDNNKQLLTQVVSKWLSPLFMRINKVCVDTQVLAIITRYIDPLNIHYPLIHYGTAFRARNMEVTQIAYLLGYPIHIFSEQPTSARDILLDQLREVYLDRSIILKRVRCICIKHALELASSNVRLNISSISDSRIEGLTNDYRNVILNEIDSISKEPITTYSPFDVIRYITPSGKVAQIVRKEYPYIIETKFNPWTMEKIPPEVIAEIETRIEISINNSLPECETMNILLDAIFPQGELTI